MLDISSIVSLGMVHNYIELCFFVVRLSIKRTELECLIKTRQESQTQLEKKLSSLRPSLETLKSTAVTLQEFFGPSLVWEREQYQLAHSLPLLVYTHSLVCCYYVCLFVP